MTLDANGFTRTTLTEIKDAIDADLKSEVSDSLNTTATGAIGQISSIIANAISAREELAEEVYNALNPDAATGTSLDNLCALTGTIRLSATQGTLTALCTGTALATLSTERKVSLNGYYWTSSSATALAATTAWASATAYTVGDVVTNDTPAKVYICTTAGTSAGSGGPTGTGTAITDGTVTWRYVGDGDGHVELDFTADDYGDDPVAYTYNDLTIETATPGWESAMALEDATQGRDEETNAALRLRRAQDIAATGNATVRAITGDVSSVSGVTHVHVFENDADGTDEDGLPPHSIEVVVLGGTDNDVAQAILDSKGAGIQDYGASSGTATDVEGNSETVYFTRPTEVSIYVDVELTKDADYPTDGDTQVKTAIVDHGNALGVGDDVVLSQLYDNIFSISGVVDVTLIEIGTAPAPSGTSNISIDDREVSDWDTSYITVTST